MLKIKNVILEISFRNDILLCNIKKGCLAILVHVFVKGELGIRIKFFSFLLYFFLASLNKLLNAYQI